MTKTEAIKLMLDGERLTNGETICWYNESDGRFWHNDHLDQVFILSINGMDFDGYEVYVELYDLNDAMDHMDKGGTVELTVFCVYNIGIRFCKNRSGVYIQTSNNHSIVVRSELRGKVWKLLDIPTT